MTLSLWIVECHLVVGSSGVIVLGHMWTEVVGLGLHEDSDYARTGVK